MANFLTSGSPLSMSIDRNQTITSQNLAGVEWGVTNNKPPVDLSWNKKPTTPNTPFTTRTNTSIPDTARTSYKPPVVVSPDKAEAAKQYLASIHAPLSAGSTGIDKANNDDYHARAQRMVDSVANGEATPEEIQQAAENDASWRPSGNWSGALAGAMAMLSGGSAQDVYKASQAASEKASQKNILASNADELRKNYTEQSIQSAIASGDQSMLVPRSLTLEEQKQAEEEKYQRNRADQQADQEAAWKHQDESQAKSFAQQWKLQTMREDQLAAKAAAKDASDAEKAAVKAEQFDRKEIKANTADLRKNQTRNTGFEKADEHMKIFDDPKATDEEKAAAWQQGREEIYTAIQASSNAEKNMEKINEMLGRNGKIQKVGDQLSIDINGVPSKAAVSYLRELLRQDKEANMAVTTDRLYAQVNNYVDDPTDKKQVEAAITKVRRASGVSIPINAAGFNKWAGEGGGEPEQPTKQGSLSSTSPTQQAPTPAPKAPGAALPRNNVQAPAPKAIVMVRDKNGNIVRQ